MERELGKLHPNRHRHRRSRRRVNGTSWRYLTMAERQRIESLVRVGLSIEAVRRVMALDFNGQFPSVDAVRCVMRRQGSTGEFRAPVGVAGVSS